MERTRMRDCHILLVEDMEELLEYNRKSLEAEGYRVSAAKNLAEARKLMKQGTPDLAVLDILLPDGSGLDFCRELRESLWIPVLFLTSLDESRQIVEGLEAGGDDYITKPYNMEVLLARVRAHLRREERLKDTEIRTGTDHLVVDQEKHRVFLDGQDLGLRPKEYLILVLLIRNRGRCLTAGQLYAEIWGQESNEDIRTVLVHVSNLRAKIKLAGNNAVVSVRNFRGEGYCYIVSEEGKKIKEEDL